MRYTKQLQADVCEDIQFGLTPQQCAEKYGIPVSVIIKWNGLEMTEQRAAEIALRKYQVEVSNTEADITDKLGEFLNPNMSDDDYFKACEIVTKNLYNLVSEVVKKERQMNPHEDPKPDAQIIIEITNKWKDNKFIKRYAI